MSVWKCPHCTSVAIVVDGAPDAAISKCIKFGCGGILDRLDEPEAGNAMRRAFFDHDHGFTKLTPLQTLEAAKSFNDSLWRLGKSLEGL